MKITHTLYRACVRTMEYLFLLRRPASLYHSNVSFSPDSGQECIDAVTIAFNNSKIIEIHNRYVSKYLKGNVNHIVVDNSSDKNQSMLIRSICEKSGVGYIRLHKNYMHIFSGSYSHATAINWTYRHVILPRKPFGFGFIDHDIFPVTDIDLFDELKRQPLYGAQRKRNGYWYLSAIISFFRMDLMERKRFDFMPVTFSGTYLDSGGGNWKSIYSLMDEDSLRFMTEKMENYREGSNRHQDQVELFDDGRWLHTINGSYWKKIDVVKEKLISELISAYENSEKQQ